MTTVGVPIRDPDRCFYMPLCTLVRGIGILRTSPFTSSRKLRQPLYRFTLDTLINLRRDPSAPPSLRRWAKAMYVAVRRYEGVRDSQKVAQLVEEDFVPIISQMPGFVAYYCVDAGDGVMVSTSVFEHKDAEEQSTFVAGEFTVEDLGPLSPNPPQVTAGEVVVYKASPS
jgi:hypothetical protein